MQEKLTAGTGIDITNNVISNTQTSAEWGNIEGDIEDQTDLADALDGKQDVLTAGNGIVIEPGTSARLPSGYTEVEYIQSDGACYVDTQVVSVGTDYVENHFQKLGTSTNVCSWFGSWEGNTLIRMSIGSYAQGFFGGYGFTKAVGSIDTDKHVIKIFSDGSSYYVQLDNSTASVYTPQVPGTITATSYLFARHGASGQSDTYDNEGTKIFYHLQKRIDGTPKMELIPCVRDSDDEPGFYDLVNERFLANSGSGTLTAGPVVTFDPATIISVDSSILPTKVSDLTNDAGYLTSSTGVTSFNGNHGAVTYTAPVTSVNNQTGAVSLSIPSKTSDLNNDSGFLTSSTGVTSFNGNHGAITYTAPVTSVNGSTGAVTVTAFSPSNAGTTDQVLTKTAGGYEWAAPSGGIENDTTGTTTTVSKIRAGTEAEYALITPDSNTIYYVF